MAWFIYLNGWYGEANHLSQNKFILNSLIQFVLLILDSHSVIQPSDLGHILVQALWTYVCSGFPTADVNVSEGRVGEGAPGHDEK